MIQRDSIVHELVLPVAPSAAFDAFVERDRLVLSIGVASDLATGRGGRFRFEATPGRFCEGEYVIVERPSRVAFTFGWTHPAMGVPPGTSYVVVTFRPVDSHGRATQLRLVHSGLASETRPQHDVGWSRFVAHLATITRPRDHGQS